MTRSWPAKLYIVLTILPETGKPHSQLGLSFYSQTNFEIHFNDSIQLLALDCKIVRERIVGYVHE